MQAYSMPYHRVIIGLREPYASGRKLTKPNSQTSADIAVARKSLYTYIKLICLRVTGKPWFT